MAKSAAVSTDLAGMPQVADVRHRFVTVRGIRIHIAVAGDDSAPTVVLLHGFPQHWYAWRGLLPMLSQSFHVVAVDLPGFGWSDPSAHGYSTTERARDVIALLDELGLPDADIVGHDWGARLGFRIALDAPKRVRHLVSVSDSHPWPLQSKLLPNLWRMWVTALFEVPGLGAFVQKRRRIIRWYLSRDASDTSVWSDELVDVYAKPTARSSIARAGQRLHGAFVLRDILRLVLRRDRKRSFETPTLLIGADRDAYIPAAVMAVPARRARMLTVEIVPGGHFILDENPREVGAAVIAHLTGGMPRSPSTVSIR
ncbi:MAG TPA: alpha/beta hydrolase [Microbacteriaceae bacterium]|jgi:pimeloyl-ACP methyl ester carboxylesterase|nr:alpha/beta hydrolase [Microbacteriaceae bacterium]